MAEIQGGESERPHLDAGRNLARSTRQHALFSVLIALCSGIAGLFLAYAQDTSAGASIVLVAAGFYLLSLLLRKWRR